MLLFLLKLLLILYLCGCAMALAMNWYLKKSKGLSGILWKECFSPVKMLSVFIGFLLFVIIPMHIFEQYVLRFYDPYCREKCLMSEAGACDSCGCNAKAKMWSPIERCSRSNWPEIIFSKKKYLQRRKEFPVKIIPEYGAVQI